LPNSIFDANPVLHTKAEVQPKSAVGGMKAKAFIKTDHSPFVNFGLGKGSKAGKNETGKQKILCSINYDLRPRKVKI
jgi:hypothetical protein